MLESTQLYGLPVPVYEGTTQTFLYRLALFVRTIPVLVQRMQSLKLDRAFLGVKKLRFVEVPEWGGRVVSYYYRPNDSVSIYPMLFSTGDRIDLAFYSGFGKRFWEVFVPADKKALWNNKLIYATASTMDRLDALLLSGQYKTYADVLKQFKSAVERLEVIHVLNALTANSVSPQRLVTGGLSIKTYPPTAKFVNRNVPYSIDQLVKLYFGADTVKSYDAVFALYCSYNGRLPVSEFSTEAALIELFKFVTFGNGFTP